MAREFKNLYDFFEYSEFCPLCNKRTEQTIIGPRIDSIRDYEFKNNNLIFYNEKHAQTLLINTLDNSINYLGNKQYENTLYELSISQCCKKYHFLYDCQIKLDLTQSKVDSILLDRIHFLHRVDASYFSINTYFLKDITDIKITKNNLTKQFILPIICFDFKNKKTIMHKLQNIQLLV